jgi:hypothetical protein
MQRSGQAIVAGCLLIMLLLAFFVQVSIWRHNDMWLAVPVVAAGLIVFAVCILTTHESGVVWIASSEHIRATIAISIVVEYMALVGVVAFFHWNLPPGDTIYIPEVTQTLVTNFTTIVGVVIAFFFGASAYVQTRETSSRRAGGEQKS